MEAKTAYVRLVPDTSELDLVKVKLDELNEALKKASSLAKELAAVETISISVAIEKKD